MNYLNSSNKYQKRQGITAGTRPITRIDWKNNQLDVNIELRFIF